MEGERRMTYVMYIVGLIFTILVSTRSGVEGIWSYYYDDAYFDRMDPEYIDVDNTNLEVAWINSTYSALSVNFTIVKTIPPDATGHFNMFQKSMGEYKTPSGISVSRSFCNFITGPLLISSFVRTMNMTQCPIPAGTYSVSQWRPSRTMPIFLPGTEYKISFVMRNKKTIFIQANVFVSLY